MPVFPVSKNNINKTLNYTLQNKGKWIDKEKSTFSVHLVCLSAFLKNCIILWLKYLDTKFLVTQRKVNGARAHSI